MASASSLLERRRAMLLRTATCTKRRNGVVQGSTATNRPVGRRIRAASARARSRSARPRRWWRPPWTMATSGSDPGGPGGGNLPPGNGRERRSPRRGWKRDRRLRSGKNPSRARARRPFPRPQNSSRISESACDSSTPSARRRPSNFATSSAGCLEASIGGFPLFALPLGSLHSFRGGAARGRVMICTTQ